MRKGGRRGSIMGREERRTRERVKRHLEKKLHREPTDEEIEAALHQLEQTHEKLGWEKPGVQPKRLPWGRNQS
jgi:DNA-directed RNA polymerase specialized sigma subunit